MAFNFKVIFNPIVRKLMEDVFDISTGHDHDGTNSKAVTTGVPAADSIVNAQINTAAAIDASKIANGTVSNTEFQYLNGVTSAIQTQINAISAAPITEKTPVNATASTGTLTISGVVVDGQTFTIGTEVYEFCADAAQSLTAGSDYAVDIEASTTKAQGTLTVDTQPTVGDTMLIGAKTYTFVAPANANDDGLVSRGTDKATAQAAIVAAIKGTDGHNTAHTQVDCAAAFAADALVITALVGGVAGNSLATTETFTAGTNIFDANTLGTTTAGVDCSAANAVTAAVLSITTNDTMGFAAADGAGDTVVITADVKGAASASTATTETMANGAWGAAQTSASVDGTVGSNNEVCADATYLYVCIATNTINDANWRRITLNSF